MEPFAQAVAFSSKEYVSGRVIDVHGLLLDGHWVGTYIGDEQSTKSEIQEINDIVALREKALLDKHTARIAELERVLNRTKATLEYVSGFTVNSGYIECHGDKCRQINCLSCGGDFAVSYEPNRIELSLAEINSVLGKGE